VSTTILNRARSMIFRDEPVAPVAPVKSVKKISAAHHAVSIVPGYRCCHEARELAGTRFLSREAPALPLKNCGSDNCSCRYEHHEDRRGGPRRARDMGVAIDGWLEIDRRAEVGRGRRQSDKPKKS
jgi:hypothetical protein